MGTPEGVEEPSRFTLRQRLREFRQGEHSRRETQLRELDEIDTMFGMAAMNHSAIEGHLKKQVNDLRITIRQQGEVIHQLTLDGRTHDIQIAAEERISTGLREALKTAAFDNYVMRSALEAIKDADVVAKEGWVGLQQIRQTLDTLQAVARYAFAQTGQSTTHLAELVKAVEEVTALGDNDLFIRYHGAINRLRGGFKSWMHHLTWGRK